MTGPDDRTSEQPAAQQPTVEPSVATAPPPAQRHRWWSAIPHHLGRARTSTVVLVLLFLSVGALYLSVKPDTETPATTPTGGTGVTEPARTTAGATTTAPPATSAPLPTTEVGPTTTEDVTTTETEETSPSEGTSDPGETSGTVPAPTTEPTPVPPVPTTDEPTG